MPNQLSAEQLRAFQVARRTLGKAWGHGFNPVSRMHVWDSRWSSVRLNQQGVLIIEDTYGRLITMSPELGLYFEVSEVVRVLQALHVLAPKPAIDDSVRSSRGGASSRA